MKFQSVTNLCFELIAKLKHIMKHLALVIFSGEMKTDTFFILFQKR